eukprot:2397607-Rhodomonas_salina.2
MRPGITNQLLRNGQGTDRIQRGELASSLHEKHTDQELFSQCFTTRNSEVQSRSRGACEWHECVERGVEVFARECESCVEGSVPPRSDSYSSS